jgi:hypothetical protein
LKRSNSFRATLAVAFVGALVAGACGDEDPVEEVEQLADCAEICGRYGDCIESIDLTACTDACEDRIEADRAVGARARSCEDCLDGRTCAEVESAGCFEECPVVPLRD